MQGIIGGIISASFPAINSTSGNFGSLYNSLTGKFSQQPTGQVIASAFSLGIGLCAGLIAFPCIWFVNRDKRKTFYQDRGHWVVEDQGLQ
jgi:cell division protein FtsX